MRLLFEQISAYSTAGLSTGITAGLRAGSKAVLILTMFIGRVGAVTLLSLWVERPEPSAALYRRNHYDWVNGAAGRTPQADPKTVCRRRLAGAYRCAHACRSTFRKVCRYV